MGRDPARSVCDGRGRVHGYEGLYIADASAIPTNLGVNPQHTIMALARYWSEGILAEG
jgi:choline dehydrogenase-like flavoprotein